MSHEHEGPGSALRQKVLAEARRHGLEEHLLSVPLVVGVSGGADSLAMLSLLRTLRGDSARETLHVAHLNHWVRGKEAHDDAEFVRQTAQAWGLRCSVAQFDVPNYARRHKLSVEDAARRARYAFFASLAQESGGAGAVAVAHNADDQVETVLMSLLRGTGLRGIGGMRALGPAHLPPTDESLGALAAFDPSKSVLLFRPLLAAWRWEILDYCKEAGLEPRWDSTNWERHYRRNRVRHDLIPMLQMQYSLAIKEHLYNLSQIAQGDEDRLAEETAALVAGMTRGDYPRGEVELPVREFARLERGLRRRVAREAIRSAAGTDRDITFKQVEAVASILAGEEGSPNAMHLPHGLVAGRHGEEAYVRRREEQAPASPEESRQVAERPQVEREWRSDFEPVMTAGTGLGWQLECAVLAEETAQPAELPGDNLTALFDLDALRTVGPLRWRTRQPGDYIEPLGMRGRKSLQDVMVDAKIPREQRDHLPVLTVESTGEALWVPGNGGRRSKRAAVSGRTRRVVMVKWRRI